MQLYHDIPKSKGVENALKRAKQMLNIQWVPIKLFPCGDSFINPDGTATRVDKWYPAYRPRTGIPYSSVRLHEKFVGFNVSFETFMTALSNPGSVLYTCSQHGVGKNMSSYYGTVCSCFASYVCGLPYRTSTNRMMVEKDVREVDITCLNGLELCDLVIKKDSHVAVITDIQRDVDRNVRLITVSESTLPLCVSNDYTPELFNAYWLGRGYHVYRYDGVHRQTYEPSPYVYVEGDPVAELPPPNTAFMSDFGDKANTRLGETVSFTVFENTWEHVEVTAPDGTVRVLPIKDGAVVYQPERAGFHSAVCHGNGETSQPVNFCVTNSTVDAPKRTVLKGDQLEFTFANAAEEKPFVYIINRFEGYTERQRGYFTEEEMAIGKKRVTVDLLPGEYYIYTVARNAYGYYTSAPCYFQIEEPA